MSLVTVVMRTYERPVMLSRAIASVQRQTMSDWSLIIVNNGGRVETVEQVVSVARIAHPDSDITVRHLPDRVGMEEASNTALLNSESEFFAIHDDDDTWKPNFLERTVDTLRDDDDAVAVVTGVTRIHELAKGPYLRPQRAERFHLDEERLTFDGMVGNNTFPPIAALFRRSLIDRVGPFDASLPVLGDWEFNLRALWAGSFLYLPDRLANYHTRTPDSDRAAGNSITVGLDLHRRTKQLLHDRWDGETLPDGRNKGEVARAAHDRFEKEERARETPAPGPRVDPVTRVVGRLVRAIKSPRVAVRSIVRRVRAKVGR